MDRWYFVHFFVCATCSFIDARSSLFSGNRWDLDITFVNVNPWDYIWNDNWIYRFSFLSYDELYIYIYIWQILVSCFDNKFHTSSDLSIFIQIISYLFEGRRSLSTFYDFYQLQNVIASSSNQHLSVISTLYLQMKMLWKRSISRTISSSITLYRSIYIFNIFVI